MRKIEFILLAICLILIGWARNEVYREYTNQRDIDGFFLQDATYKQSKDIADRKDKLGDWVCVNTKGMDFKDIVKTCQHEAGHEVFAEVIEKHPEKINKVMEIIGR